jgi:hypothetical protein
MVIIFLVWIVVLFMVLEGLRRQLWGQTAFLIAGVGIANHLALLPFPHVVTAAFAQSL